jgi:Ni/Fe-hydrogenase subunit HybB-like protein
MSWSEYLRSLLTPGNALVALIVVVGVGATVLRFTGGLAQVTNLNDNYPWGLWIGVDVLCGVALAAGAFTVACAVHVFGLHAYKPLVRPAVLTGFLLYLVYAIGLTFDLGRPWRLPYPIFVSHGTTSVMFEVAWCVAMYLTVLFLEFSPMALEWLGLEKLRRVLARLTLALAILGVVLSTLHQSALGGLFLIAPDKVHPLWYTGYIPVFFLLSAIGAGLSMVIVGSSLSNRIFRDRVGRFDTALQHKLLLGLSRTTAMVLATYFCLKWIGVAHDHKWAWLATGYGAWFLVEVFGFVLAPALLFMAAVKRRSVRMAQVAAVMTVVGLVLNRLNIAMFTFNWQMSERYVPHWMEVAITLMLFTVGLMAYRFIVNRMSILDKAPVRATGVK